LFICWCYKFLIGYVVLYEGTFHSLSYVSEAGIARFLSRISNGLKNKDFFLFDPREAETIALIL